MIEIIEKYYLICDGKMMLEYIVSEENVQLLLEVLMYQQNVSLAVVPVVMAIMKYYCLSSFNQEDLHNI